jgi:hypothetical protein
MSNDSLFLQIATLLWAVTITPVKDEAGIRTIPDLLAAVHDGIVA